MACHSDPYRAACQAGDQWLQDTMLTCHTNTSEPGTQFLWLVTSGASSHQLATQFTNSLGVNKQECHSLTITVYGIHHVYGDRINCSVFMCLPY
jgi:hypothetical protein